MDYSKSQIIEEINKLIPEHNFKQEQIITSGGNYYGWVRERIVWDTQVIINAVKCNEQALPDMEKKITFQLEQEFRSIIKVEPIFYPYSNLELMEGIVNGVVAHYGVSALVGDILQDKSCKDGGKTAGYIVLTAVRFPRIA
ncbi:hypothetical protein [Chitinophaga sancti]|uniref:Uncharacterized protein n=1 Tax=Chitinophaga sancti TaxID=1004 RepID=A0A1K1S359_9BACT|nr:hypothetical protein [Chitinophaga sancti]WQD63786.1 hypothetical protein U0033_05210 [Chitinophaga sancti]WQG90589.1 hypothetical protein SR876_03710 [Chitinophaga sancti]SFW78856.1 hypothetical protein SAMN05661012_04674 [Chitinophaga sancti]